MTAEAEAATAALRTILGDSLLALYLHGSAVAGGLRPQSDIDLLAVVEALIPEHRRAALLAALLRISGRHPAPPQGPRCLEVTIFRRQDLAAGAYPARAEFTYGEWLRDAFEAGGRPLPATDPDHTLVLAQARRAAVALIGPEASAILPGIPDARVRQAMRGALPALNAGLDGDTRNVLLTLARMWHTAVTGDFVPKDAAAV